MSETKKRYALLGILALTIVAEFGFVLTETAAISNVVPSLSSTPTLVPSPSPTPYSLIVAPEGANAYFALQNNEIRYENYSSPISCDYFMSGSILDAKGIPFINFEVHLQRVDDEGVILEALHPIVAGTDPFFAGDPSTWETRFTLQAATYELWLTSNEGDVQLSPHILVPMRDCNHNHAIVNFIQVRPLPTNLPSSAPLVETVTTLLETDAPFVVENNQITYSYWRNLGRPCYCSMVGRVLDLQGRPFTNFVVNIKMVDIEDLGPVPPGYASPGAGGYAEDGPSGWGSMLPSWTVSYEVWLATEIGANELSSHILVKPHDCVHNEARINFVQVRPIP